MTQQNACLKAFLPLLLRYQNSGVSLPFFTKHFSLLPKFLVPLSCRLYNIFSTKLEWWSIFLAMWWWWSSFRSDTISLFLGQTLPSLLMWFFGLYDFWGSGDFFNLTFRLWYFGFEPTWTAPMKAALTPPCSSFWTPLETDIRQIPMFCDLRWKDKVCKYPTTAWQRKGTW